MTAALSAADRLAVRELAERYAAAADRRDAELFAALWAPGARLRVSWPDGREPTVVSTPAGFAAIVDGLRRYVRTLHIVANQLCEPWADGDVAAEVYCEAHHLGVPDGNTDRVLFIRYDDRYRRCDGGWRFIERGVNVLWAEDRQVLRPARP